MDRARVWGTTQLGTTSICFRGLGADRTHFFFPCWQTAGPSSVFACGFRRMVYALRGKEQGRARGCCCQAAAFSSAAFLAAGGLPLWKNSAKEHPHQQQHPRHHQQHYHHPQHTSIITICIAILFIIVFIIIVSIRIVFFIIVMIAIIIIIISMGSNPIIIVMNTIVIRIIIIIIIVIGRLGGSQCTLRYITLHYITLHYITLYTYIHTYITRVLPEGGFAEASCLGESSRSRSGSMPLGSSQDALAPDLGAIAKQMFAQLAAL